MVDFPSALEVRNLENMAVDPSAVVGDRVFLGQGVRIWGDTQVRELAVIGANTVLGRGVYIGVGVSIGSNCKVQNGAQIYDPARIGSGVFIGPGVIMTNDKVPRAVTSNGHLKDHTDWEASAVVVGDGASIGAGAVCVSPLEIGAWALVGAGAVVTRDVAPHSIVVGAPARHVGWAGRSGKPLQSQGSFFVCPDTGERYRLSGAGLELLVAG